MKKILVGLLVLVIVAGAVVEVSPRGEESVPSGQVAEPEGVYVVVVPEEMLAEQPPVVSAAIREILPYRIAEGQLSRAVAYYLYTEDEVPPELSARVVGTLVKIEVLLTRGVPLPLFWVSWPDPRTVPDWEDDWYEQVRVGFQLNSYREIDQIVQLGKSRAAPGDGQVLQEPTVNAWFETSTYTTGVSSFSFYPYWVTDYLVVSCAHFDTNHTVNGAGSGGYACYRSWNNQNTAVSGVSFRSWVGLE